MARIALTIAITSMLLAFAAISTQFPVKADVSARDWNASIAATSPSPAGTPPSRSGIGWD